MAFGGQLYIATGNQEPLTITEAIVTSDRIFVEWTRGEQIGHLEATSNNGVTFSGEFREPVEGRPGTCELTLYKSLHEYLLFGSWVHTPSAQRGTWAFRLQTDVVRANKTPRPQASPAPEPSREKPTPAVQVEMTKPSGESLSTRASQPRSSQPRPAPASWHP